VDIYGQNIKIILIENTHVNYFILVAKKVKMQMGIEPISTIFKFYNRRRK